MFAILLVAAIPPFFEMDRAQTPTGVLADWVWTACVVAVCAPSGVRRVSLSSRRSPLFAPSSPLPDFPWLLQPICNRHLCKHHVCTKINQLNIRSTGTSSLEFPLYINLSISIHSKTKYSLFKDMILIMLDSFTLLFLRLSLM